MASAQREEPLHGTASTVRSFLLVQQEGPWGRDALRESRLPPDVADWLVTTGRRVGVRPLLVRRHDRAEPSGIRVFAAHADPRRPWMETALLDDVGDVAALDLGALAAGRSCGLPPTDDPVLLACTHGSHDACCAVEGRPVAATLALSHPGLTWEVSHIGGDRFAGNLLVLPHGLYYGRVTADNATAIAATHLDGRLDLTHLRGRSSRAFAVQSAEHHLRTHLDLDGIDEVDVRTREVVADTLAVTFNTAGGAWRVVVATSRGTPHLLTCRSIRPNAPLVVRLVDIHRLPDETGPSGPPVRVSHDTSSTTGDSDDD